MSKRRFSFLLVIPLMLFDMGPAFAQLGDTVTITDYPRYATTLSPEQTAYMHRFAQAVVAVLNGGASIAITTVGFADFDAQGRAFENQVSRDRAQAAQTELKKQIDEQARLQAVPPSRMQALSYAEPTVVGTQRPRFVNPVSEEQRKANRRVEITWAGTRAPPPPPPSAVACVKRVTGANPPRSQWAELEAFAATRGLNPAILSLQPIPQATGNINTDFFALTIDAQGQSAPQLQQEFRSNFNAIVFTGSNGQSIAPYDATNAAQWNSSQYKGAVMSFVLDTMFGIQAETGAVVAVCTSPTDWVFSTVTTLKDHEHPVSGNRSFGVFDNGDGSLTLFTKATDRVVDALPYSAAPDLVFSKGEEVWRRMLDNMTARYVARQPRGRTEVSVRRPY